MFQAILRDLWQEEGQTFIHVDHVGMGNDRKTISHIGIANVATLSNTPHRSPHTISNEMFIEKYHLTPIGD